MALAVLNCARDYMSGPELEHEILFFVEQQLKIVAQPPPAQNQQACQVWTRFLLFRHHILLGVQLMSSWLSINKNPCPIQSIHQYHQQENLPPCMFSLGNGPRIVPQMVPGC